MTDVRQICDEMVAELIRSRGKHPQAFHNAHEGYAILLEEVDELWEEVKRQEPSAAKQRKELIQCGAMVIRFVQDIIDSQIGAQDFRSHEERLNMTPGWLPEYDGDDDAITPIKKEACLKEWHQRGQKDKVCTRTLGHSGMHVAADTNGRIVFRWV